MSLCTLLGIDGAVMDKKHCKPAFSTWKNQKLMPKLYLLDIAHSKTKAQFVLFPPNPKELNSL